MRRPTINPKPSLRPGLQTPRASISTANTSTRRDIRQIRDKSNIQQSVLTLEQFLNNQNFPNMPKSLTSPSAKDVQQIFKFIFSFVDSSFEYISRFEDEAMNMLKGLKYPYISEINRSQFVAVTPHSWPVILSMFVWVIELVTFLEVKNEEDQSQSLNSLFYEHVKNGYQSFLNGTDENGDESFKKKVFDMYQDIFIEIDKRVLLLKEIEEKIECVGEDDYEMSDIGKISKKEFLNNKKTEILNDIKSLATRKKQLEDKKKKYEMVSEKMRITNDELEEEITTLKNEITNLKNEISAQKINPEDIKEMNKEKIEMYNEIEKLKPMREDLIKQCSEKEKILNDYTDSIDKLIFDLKGLRNGELPFSIKKENNEYIMQGEFTEFDKVVNEGIRETEETINDIECSLSALDMKNSEYEIVVRELKENIKHYDEKLITLGKLYLEKKSLHEIEQRKSNGELNKIESELIKLDLESNHSLLLSEQRLQMARIQYEKMLNTIKNETEEIGSEISNLDTFLISKKKEISRLISKFSAL